jgi:hypothetical protein
MWTLFLAPFLLIGPAAVFWINLVLLRRWGKRPKLTCFNCATLTGICSLFGEFCFPVTVDRIVKLGDDFGLGLAITGAIPLLLLSWFAGWFWLLMRDNPPK